MSRIYRKSRRACTALLLAALPMSAASAANLTWDSGGASPAAPVDGPGTWDSTTNADWSNGGTDAVWPNDGSTAVFGGTSGTPGTVTLGTPISAGGLIFNSTATTGYVITDGGSGNTLTLGGPIAVNAGSHTLNVPISGAPSISLGTSATAVAAGLTVATSFSAGAFSASTNSNVVANTNVLTINGGQTLTVGGAFNVGLYPTTGTSTTLFKATGTGTLAVSNAANFTVAGNTTTPNGTETSISATADLSGLSNFSFITSGTNTTPSAQLNELDVGTGFRGTGTLKLANVSNSITAPAIRIGDSSFGGSQNSVTATSTLSLGAGTNTLKANTITVGNAKSNGALNFLTTTGSLTLSPDTTATFNLSIGTTVSGSSNSTGTVALAGGHNVTMTNGGTLSIANRASAGNAGVSATGSFAFDNGTVSFTTVNIAQSFGTTTLIGPSTGTLTIGTDATSTEILNVNTTHPAGTTNFLLTNAAGGTATGTFKIQGGTANINTSITEGGVAANDTASIQLSAGTLNMMSNPIGTAAAPIGLTTTGGTLQNVSEVNGGSTPVTMATASNTLTFAGANTWSGPSNISAGTGALAPSGTLGNTAISVSGGAIFSAAAGTSAGLATGTVGASLSLASSSTLNMNDGTTGAFTIQQPTGAPAATSLSLAGATINMDLSSTAADQLVDNAGATSVSGLNIINLLTTVGTTSLTTGQYTLISAPSGLTGNFAFDGAGDQTETMFSGTYTLTLSNSDTAEILTISAVPEPATAGLLLLGAAGMLSRRRRPVVR